MVSLSVIALLRPAPVHPAALRWWLAFRCRFDNGGLGPQGAMEMPPGSVFPLEYGFADMQAIDFQKGCFVGQEVTSRTHRKGSLRKKLYPIVLSQAVGASGDKLMTGNGNAQRVGGELVARHEMLGLALIREDAKTEKLTLNDTDIAIQSAVS